MTSVLDALPRRAALGVVALVLALGGGLAAPTTPARAAEPDPAGVWPLRPEPEVVAAFDPPSSPYSAGHRGVDLAGASGQRVLAALPGTVSYAGMLAGRGVVVVDHGRPRTTYQPVRAGVAVGDVVAAGDPIGRLELIGSHCLPRACVHWGWVEGETYLDPLRLVGAGPVRLLPLWRDLPVTSGAPTQTALPPAALRSPWESWRPPVDLLGLRGAT